MKAQILGTGSCLPEKIVTNDYLSDIVDTSDEWIVSRTGIRQRHIAVEEGTASMSVSAAKKALESAGVEAGELDLIVVATCTPDTYVPNTACIVQSELGADKAIAFDISAACSGFVFALNMVNAYIMAGVYKKALVIGAEVLSRIVDWTDRSTCVIFADGAGAAVVGASETGVIASDLGSDGSRGGAIYAKNRENFNPFVTERKPDDYVYMDGGEVFKFAVKTVPESIKRTLDKVGMVPDDVDIYILHQANARINSSIAKKLKVSMEKIPMNLDRCGNTSAASVPLMLDEANRKGLIKSGDKVMLAGFGAGLTWGTILLEWA